MSTDYAGSTVLGLALGSHSDGVFLGEPYAIVRKNSVDQFRNTVFCSVCRDQMGEQCPLWSTAIIQAVRKNPEHFYRIMSARVSAKLFIDSSKNIEWLELTKGLDDVECLIIHISKSVEAFVASARLRRGKKHSIERLGTWWAARNETIRDYATGNCIPYLHIRYRDFAQEPVKCMNILGNFLSFSPSEDQLEFWQHEHHYVKGNPGTTTHLDKKRIQFEDGVNRRIYSKRHQTIFYDEKWKQVLKHHQVNRLYALPEVSRQSKKLGYAYPYLERNDAPLLFRLQGAIISTGVKLYQWGRKNFIE